MKGANITGGQSFRGRAEDDFYATNPVDVERFLKVYGQINGTVLEPCIGQGHIAKVLQAKCNVVIRGIDIKERKSGFTTKITDFLTYNDCNEVYDYVITNPPYSLAEEFIRKSFTCIKQSGKVIMFLKLQFLEGSGRQKLFNEFPPKFIYVCRKRAQPLRMGSEIDPATGKKWKSSTICFAWFVWEKGFNGEPTVRWC